ncbi:MAG: glutathione S-transferase family protein [Hyphomicrobiaceae bacterium]|nr:glutathione S-transferase family protein [Hyphomicrobiaceae bacterium]
MKILGRKTSINVRKVLWLAAELGLDYEHEVWGRPDRDPNVAEFLALNPNAFVPVLIDGDFVLWESHAIMRYLVEREGRGPVPADIEARALMNQWLDWQGSDLSPSATYAVMARVRKIAGWDDPERIKQSLAGWTRHMNILENTLADGRPFIIGDGFTLADISIGLQVYRWTMIDGDVPEMPNSLAYLGRLLQRPAAAPWMMPATP